MGQGGRRDPGEYVLITAEVFNDPATGRKRVRPAADEIFPSSMYIECSKALRALASGTRVRIRVVETAREDGRPFLYSSYQWKYEVVR